MEKEAQQQVYPFPAFASLILPGFGQILKNDTNSGATMMFLHIMLLAIALYFGLMLLLIINFLITLYSVYDAYNELSYQEMIITEIYDTKDETQFSEEFLNKVKRRKKH